MKAVFVTIAALGIIMTLGCLVFIYSGTYNVAAAVPHGRVLTWAMHTTMAHSVGARATDIVLPADFNQASRAKRGINDFAAMCVACHGAPGRQRDAVGQGLNPLPPELTHASNNMSAAEIFWIVKNGIKMTGMPAWGASHDDAELWDIVDFVKSELGTLSPAAYRTLLRHAQGHGHHESSVNAANESSAREHGGHHE